MQTQRRIKWLAEVVPSQLKQTPFEKQIQNVFQLTIECLCAASFVVVMATVSRYLPSNGAPPLDDNARLLCSTCAKQRLDDKILNDE
ncbi:hypothetical protein QE152_g25481 [Popillia japonica]|uniref:Uncharacterized protein n=1 Tax=Popillia japonica TaxID=7064 RepID=A0AAW1K2N7_POPJA